MFAEKIKELRKLKSLSQYQLARDLKVSQPTINSWEKGNRTPTFATLQTIADYFGVSIDYLLDRDQDDVTEDDFQYALYNEAKDLTEEDRKQLLDMARFLKMRQDIDKNK